MMAFREASLAGRNAKGFTLIEMSVSMMLLGLIAVAGTHVLKFESGQAARRDTRAGLSEIEEALTAYWVMHGRLPCPANGALTRSDSDYGQAGPLAGGGCDATVVPAANRIVPWRSLGLREPQAVDGWQRRITYVPSPALVDGTAMTGDLSVRDGVAARPDTQEITPAAAYILLSHGQNGHGGWLESGSRMPFAAANTDELDNIDGSPPFINAYPNADGGQGFDDVLHWRLAVHLIARQSRSFLDPTCTSANDLWVDRSCSSTSVMDVCVVASAVLGRCPSGLPADSGSGSGGGDGDGGDNATGGGDGDGRGNWWQDYQRPVGRR